MIEPPVVMFLSTGRCGTQWLTAGIAELHPAAEVAHEPIGPLYRPRRYFRRYENPGAILEAPEVAAHVDRIERSRRAYVETGWPLFPVLPLLAERLRGRLRIVHLTRHPVPSALSHLAHKSYAGSPRADAYTLLATLGPMDPGVFAPQYGDRWDELSAYEKCLYWWTEVHHYGLELAERLAGIPLLRVSSEAVLGGDAQALRELLEFAELRWDDRWRERAGQVVDRWRHHTDQELDPLAIRRHPWTLQVAGALGYAMSTVIPAELAARYRGSPDPGLDRFGRFGSGVAPGAGG